MFDILNIFAALVTLGLGLYGLTFPHRAAALVRLAATSAEGRSEFRASFGGLWVGLGAIPLITMEPLLFAMAGLIWLTTALGRAVSFALDGTLTRLNGINLLFELGCSLLLLVGAPIAALLPG